MRKLGWLVLVLLSAACGDDPMPATMPSSVTPTAVTPAGAWIRVANFSADLAGSSVELGSSSLRPSIGYPQVTGYRRVEPGAYIVRFRPSDSAAVDPRGVPLNANVTVGTGQAVTVVAAGLVTTRTLEIVAMADELVAPDGARIRFVNAMSDFPATLDLWLRSDMPLLRNVAFLEDRGYRSASAGNHPIEVRRNGSAGSVLPVISRGIAAGATYTVFAFGTLRQGDLDYRLVIDATQGRPALKR